MQSINGAMLPEDLIPPISDQYKNIDQCLILGKKIDIDRAQEDVCRAQDISTPR